MGTRLGSRQAEQDRTELASPLPGPEPKFAEAVLLLFFYDCIFPSYRLDSM